VQVLELPEIRAISPTLAETMRLCFLRAGLSKASGSSNFVLGNPKAWLGAAYHEVLEKIGQIDLGQESLEDAVERLWSHAVAALQQRTATHVLDHRFGSPTTWRGYYVARASVLLRAQELTAGPPPTGPPVAKMEFGAGPIGPIREQEFSAFGGRLLGRPDVIRFGEVIDYKSGALVEHDAAAQTDGVKSAYVRQLRIYGYLVKANLGWWPERGVLLPLGGTGVAIALDPAECEREAAEAVSLLEEYNAKVIGRRPADDFATATSLACRWCPFKLICPAFWPAASPSWSRQLDGAAIEGELAEPLQGIHGGAAVAISVDVQRGTEPARRAQIAPLNLSVHSVAGSLTVGDRVRLVALRNRQDGQLAPGPRTLVARVADIPSIEARNQEGI
jgi:hypothetical protein